MTQQHARTWLGTLALLATTLLGACGGGHGGTAPPASADDVFFEKDDGIWVVPLDGSRPEESVLEITGAVLSGVAVEPGGGIVFSRWDGGHDVPLWRSNADGTGLSMDRTVAGHWLQFPTFLTDTEYALSQGTDTDDGDIWYVNGAIETQLTGTASLADGDGNNDYDPSFGLVGGVDVIFFSRHDATNTTSDIYWVSLDGTTVTPLVADPAFSEDHPSYSPANDLIVFERGVDDLSEDDLYVVNPDGTGLTQITSGPDDDDDPVWSSDGKWIIFQRDNGTTVQIVKIPWPALTPVTVLAEGSAPAVRP